MAREEDYHPMATDEPVYEIDSFELLWERHKAAIIGGAVVVLAAIVGVFGWMIVGNANRAKAEVAFAAAKDAEAYRAIIEDFPKSPVAGNSALLLAGALREEGKAADANAVLQEFLRVQPKHEFAPLAKIALAEDQAAAGNDAQAAQDLQAVADVDSESFAAPYALMLEAELDLAGWKRNDALRSYEQLFRLYPESVAAQSSEPQYNALQAMSRPVSKKAREAAVAAPAENAAPAAPAAPAE